MPLSLLLAWLMLAPLEQPLANAAQEAHAQILFQQLRCQVCAGQSIADSNAELARSMRMVVREEVAKGDSDQVILDRLQQRYGEGILMKPPFTPVTYALWLGPLILLLLGGAIYLLLFRKQRSQP